MYRSLLLIVGLAVPVFSNSAGAPQAICKNGLTPEHHVDPQSSSVPYSFSGESTLKVDGKLSLTLGGSGGFLGFAVQAHNARGQPIGTFKLTESGKSQTLTCSKKDDTLTHKKIPRDHPLQDLKFDWVPPQGYTGKVKFVATVAKDGGTYWIRKVTKEVNVQ